MALLPIKMIKLGVLAVGFAILMACAQTEKRQVYPSLVQIVWPSLPAKPRIRYVGHFSNPEEFGISKGFFDYVVEFFTGEAEQHLVRPMAVLALSPQEIYVADPGAEGVHYFNAKQGDYRFIQRAENQPLPSPIAMTRGPDQSILVTDSELGKVFQITAKTHVAVPVQLDTPLKQPTGIAYDAEGERLYVVDTKDHAVKIFSRNGQLVKTIGKRGNGKAKFNFPTFIWRDDQGGLLVTDSLNFRIQRFNREGRYLGRLGQIGDVSGSLSRPKGVATDRFGHIYVMDGLFHAMQIFNQKGQLLLNIGQQGANPGQFWLPGGVFVSETNMIYVADSDNRRVQVFQYIRGR